MKDNPRLFDNLIKYGSIETEDIGEMERVEVFRIDPETWQGIVARIDREIMASCKTKIWINSKLYTPTEREKPYVVGEIGGEYDIIK
jgi:hypothetical protein